MTVDAPASRTSAPAALAATPRSLYRALALAEMATWTLLILGMVLKYAVKLGDWPVQLAGMVHGVVFVSYAVTAALVGVNQHWPVPRIAAAVALAVVPSPPTRLTAGSSAAGSSRASGAAVAPTTPATARGSVPCSGQCSRTRSPWASRWSWWLSRSSRPC